VEKAGITLRTYRADDLGPMHALDVVCFEKPFRFTRGAMRRFAEDKKARVTITEDKDSLVGFVILHIEEVGAGRIGYIITLDVSPEHRRRGVAGRLTQEAERQAQREGCAALVLHVFTGNEAAIRFYASHGFVRSHREEEFYGPAMDAWVFNKLLVSTSE
jgi:[ribosomal protein S18]-alanine N-acetyltransferase